MQPTPLPRPDGEPKPDLVESLQQSDLKRWSPRRADLPALLDGWPSYVALAALAVIAVLGASRLVLETLVPFAHVLLVFSLAAALTFAIAPLVGRLEAARRASDPRPGPAFARAAQPGGRAACSTRSRASSAPASAASSRSRCRS